MNKTQQTIYETLLENAKEARYTVESLTARNNYLLGEACKAARNNDLNALKQINCEMRLNNNYASKQWDIIRAPAAYKTQVFCEKTQGALAALNELRQLIKR